MDLTRFVELNGGSATVLVPGYSASKGGVVQLTKIDVCRKHYAEVGLGEDYVDRFIRWLQVLE